MPPTLTAPGVYIQELPAASRSIAGVSTSLTAFVGPASRGPVNEPTKVTSWAEFERMFGGLSPASTMTQTVRHYFQNGGTEALVVRVVNAEMLVLSATAAALSAPGFARLRATVAPGAGTQFDLTVALVDASDAVIDDGNPYTATVTLDTAAPNLAAVDAMATGHGTPVLLVTAAGDFPTVVPAAGLITAPAHTPGTVTVGSGAMMATGTVDVGLRLAVTDAASAVAGFDHLAITVANRNPGAGTFDLTIALADAANTVLADANDDPFTVTLTGLDISADYGAQIAAAATATAPAITPVELVGGAPPALPHDGTTVSVAAGDAHIATIATRRAVLTAASEGAWGNRLQATVSYEDATGDAFHLRVAEVAADGAVVNEEVFYNLSTTSSSAGFVERVLDERSALARVQSVVTLGALPATTVPTTTFSGGADGGPPRTTDDIQGSALDRTGIQALVTVDLFNLLCVPLETWSTSNAGHVALWSAVIAFANDHQAVALVDPPAEWITAAAAVAGANTLTLRDHNAALYFPRIRVPDPLNENRLGEFPPCGVVAGAIARTDGQRGIWKAPAGIDVNLVGVPELALRLTDPQQGDLNRLGINCLRTFPVYGRVIWGARTLRGADVLASEWKYLPVRRLALYIEESLRRGTTWAVFEGNDEPLWSQLRLSVGAFMHQLFRQGAFQGASAAEAYFVKCDADTTPPADRDAGIVNVLVGFAPLKPAEFVIIKLQQLAAQSGS
jgi:phage tail sheath protein FI